MNSIYMLIPLSLVLIGAGVWAFFWAVNAGQFDDLDGEDRAILDEADDAPPPPATPLAGTNPP